MASYEGWNIRSWESLPTAQQPDYPNAKSLQKTLEKIRELPELVFPHEIDLLKQELAKCARGQQFVLQCGDCAESFTDCTASITSSKLKSFEAFQSVLSDYLSLPIVMVGRIAGQFAKPRSETFETVLTATGIPIKVKSYKGDLINSTEAECRDPNPKRMLDGYYRAAAVLNRIRQETGRRENQVFTSHESLLLSFESALTRESPNGFYNTSAHMVWLGERTRKLGGGHVEYLSGIRNPVGVKIGPTTNVEELIEIMRTLNPENEEGKLVLIPRIGARLVRLVFGRIVEAVRSSGVNHLWECDPMHGNTYKTPDGIKTRNFSDIAQEIFDVIDILREHGEDLSGLHLETSYEDVTECVGGRSGVTEELLYERYTSQCDPRLNVEQTKELLEMVGRKMAGSG